jgi:hypothetical protein
MAENNLGRLDYTASVWKKLRRFTYKCDDNDRVSHWYVNSYNSRRYQFYQFDDMTDEEITNGFRRLKKLLRTFEIMLTSQLREIQRNTNYDLPTGRRIEEMLGQFAEINEVQTYFKKLEKLVPMFEQHMRVVVYSTIGYNQRHLLNVKFLWPNEKIRILPYISFIFVEHYSWLLAVNSHIHKKLELVVY